MSSISSNPLMGAHSYNFDYSAIAKKRSNSEQSLFNVSNNNQSETKQGNVAIPQKSSGQALFEQNLYEAVANANNAASASSGSGATEKEEKGFFDLMIEAIAEAFKAAFEEELEKNGGNTKTALIKAKASVNVNALSDQELSDVIQDLASEYSAKTKNGTNVEANKAIVEGLQEEIATLDEKIRLEDMSAKLNDDNTKANSNNDNIVDPFMSFLAQNKDGIGYKNNRQNTKMYEAMFAENARGKNMNANNMNTHNRETLNIMV